MNRISEARREPSGQTLLQVCQQVASDEEWAAYVAGHALGTAALRKAFADDFSECSPEAQWISYADRPYEAPDDAIAYLQSRQVARSLFERAMEMMSEMNCRAEGRREGQATFTAIDLRAIAFENAEFDTGSLTVDGVKYHDLVFYRTRADRDGEMINLIIALESQMDPTFHRRSDFRDVVQKAWGAEIPDSTFRDALKAAGANKLWFKGGRKRGSPSHPNLN